MRRPTIWMFVCVGIAFAFVGSPSGAREPYVEFLRGLQQRGMGEQGLAYIDQIANRADLPADLKASLDLERSKCLRVAANEASDARQRDARLAESKRLSEKFFADHPSHPSAATVVLSDGDESLARGEQKLAAAKSAPEGDNQKKAFAEARQTLTEARGRYDSASGKLKERLDAATKQEPGERAADLGELTLPWIDARSKSAYSSYLLSQTYLDPSDPDRRKWLEQASRGFDAVYQEFSGVEIGLLNRVWHAKTLAELGDAKTALDIFDEVLIADPESPDAGIELAALFGQAELFRLQLLAKDESHKTIIEDGEQWLNAHKKWQPTSQYQGIALEIAKARLGTADTARPADRTKILRDVAAALAVIGKVDSEFRQEALRLRRETMARLGTGAGLSLTEALTLGDEAASDGNWVEAVPLFRQAVETATKANDTKNLEAAKTKLAQALYRQAISHYGAGDFEKTLDVCGKLVIDYPDSAVAQDASAVAIAAALSVYSAAEEGEARTKAAERLDRVASYAISHWRDKPVADDARMALAQAALIRGDFEATQRHLADVGSQSKRYASTLSLMAQVAWRQYLAAKKSSDAESRGDEIAKLREQAITNVNASLQRQRASWQSASEPMPAALFETQLLLAEIHLEGQQWAEAEPLFEPLVAFLRASKPATLDRNDQRALVGAVRVALAMNKWEQATESAPLLIDLTPDEEQANAVLVELAKLIGQHIKQAEAATAPAEQQTTFASRPFASPLRELQGRLVDALAPRNSLAVQQLIFLGDACISLERPQQAREIYERVLKTIDRDESAKASAGAAAIGIRARFVSLLRSEGQLDEASRQVAALIQERPNSLEPLMEKGYILQSQAERDPKRYDECIAHWTDLRVRLSRSRPRPAEYYDVLYNAATCLVRQSRATNNKEKALQAEQLLKSTLTLTPNLNGPDNVAKYNALLAQAIALRGPAAAPGAAPQKR